MSMFYVVTILSKLWLHNYQNNPLSIVNWQDVFLSLNMFIKKENNADKANMHSRTMWSLKESHVYDGLLFILLSEGERYEEGEAYDD